VRSVPRHRPECSPRGYQHARPHSAFCGNLILSIQTTHKSDRPLYGDAGVCGLGGVSETDRRLAEPGPLPGYRCE
jgi:hypothetical protein